MTLISKTYWGQMPFWFRGRAKADMHVESLALRTDDFRQIRANFWTSAAPAGSDSAGKKPRIGVVLMHPRIDFSHHYAVPRLVAAGFSVLAANSRHVQNDMMCEHEELVLDLAAAVKWMRAKGGAEKIVLFGNCGGGSLAAYFQAQAKLAKGARIERSPGGAPSGFAMAEMVPADALCLVAAHRGQGHVMLQSIDAAVIDEDDAFSTDPALDMYHTRNGFKEPPAPSAFPPEFLARYREAQVARVRRLDDKARQLIGEHTQATDEIGHPDFEARPFDQKNAVLRKRAHEPVMVIHRTMANPSYVDPNIHPSAREYGSLLSDRPDLMNMAAIGFGRVCTPRAWLSTWSALSTNADLAINIERVTEPTLVVHADRDREVYFEHDVAPVFAASAAKDKTLVRIDARHYFERNFDESQEKEAPDVERLMDVVVPWIRERFA